MESHLSISRHTLPLLLDSRCNVTIASSFCCLDALWGWPDCALYLRTRVLKLIFLGLLYHSNRKKIIKAETRSTINSKSSITGKGNKGMPCGSPEANYTTVAHQNLVNCSVMDHKLIHPFPSRFSCLPLALTANPRLPWCISKLTLPTSFPLKVGIAYHLMCHILSCACCFPPRCHIPSHLQLSWYMHAHARVCECVRA